MFDPGAADVVGAAILELLRHDEQGNASRARGRALHPGKNQVDDIVAPVMLAIAGKDLAAGDPEAAVRLLNRLRRDQRQVGARLWLGETHAGRPPTRRKIWDVQPLLRFATLGEEELDRGLREMGEASCRERGCEYV